VTYTSEIRFATKPQIALEQIRAAHAAGIAPGVIVADAAYGNTTSFRDEITEMGLQYILCVQSNTTAWPPGEAPLPPRKRKNRLGRPRTALRRTAQHAPVALAELAAALPSQAFRTVTWREGTKTPLESRFAAVRVRPAHRDTLRSTARDEEWLLIEWPTGEAAPTEVLAFKSADVNDARRACEVRSISLAHRTRLPGIKRRTGPGSLRRSKLARLSPPCDAVHRSVRIPDRRTRRFFPQWNSPRSLAAISHTHRFPTTRIFRCALNVMFPRRSLLAALSSSPHLRQSLPVAQPVCNRDLRKVLLFSAFYDTLDLSTPEKKGARHITCRARMGLRLNAYFLRSKRSASITLVHAATKSRVNFPCESVEA